MTRKTALLLCLLSGAVGIVAGLYVRQEQLQTAVIVTQAKADAYALAAMETAQNCAPTRGHFQRPQ